ncbi:YdaU family protein [Acinetobacter junii]|uniref:YdaU family protein n=1 Tax=Acinetobacter junii TaxID=40215 RepID=UPI00124F9A01|nr:YdaU family protein [Acinetobacter junii]
MHYYKRNLGDYAKKAGRLTMLEHGAYNQLLDAIYDREEFPTLEQALDWTWARDESEITAVKFVLSKFFEAQEDGRYVQNRIKEELEAYKSKAENNARIAKEREEKRKNGKRSANDSSPSVHETCGKEHEASPNHKPVTNNHKPVTNIDISEEESSQANVKPKTPRITKKQAAISELVSLGLDVKFAQPIIEKRNGKAFSDVAMDEIKEQAALAQLTVIEALEFAARQDWGSFRADWYQNRVKQQSHQPVAQQTANEQAKWDDFLNGGPKFVDVSPKKSILIEGVGHA